MYFMKLNGRQEERENFKCYSDVAFFFSCPCFHLTFTRLSEDFRKSVDIVVAFVACVDVALVVALVELLVITSILFSGFDAIETLTSLKRFKWKSNCASANHTSARKKINFSNKKKKMAEKINSKYVIFTVLQ